MLNLDLLNTEIARFDIPIEAGRVALFRKAIGETPAEIENSINKPVPPTLIGLGLDPAPFDFIELFDRDLASLLHAQQSIRYHQPIYVGDVLSGSKRVSRIFDKKDGQLEFLVLEIDYYNQNQELVGVSEQTLVFVKKQELS